MGTGKKKGILNLTEATELLLKGIAGLVPVIVLLILAYAIGDTVEVLGTGPFLARAAEGVVNPVLMAPILFFIACFMSFATGSSWGTWAVMIPIAVSLSEAAGLPLPFIIGAVLGGGIFGDHCSPISDTTIVASMAAATDHIDHVNTQIPYAVTAAAAAAVLFLLAGLAL